MDVLRYLTDQKRRQAIVILAERQTTLSGSVHKPDTALIQQGRVGRWRNCLGHNVCIDDNALDAKTIFPPAPAIVSFHLPFAPDTAHHPP